MLKFILCEKLVKVFEKEKKNLCFYRFLSSTNMFYNIHGKRYKTFSKLERFWFHF